MYKPSIKIDQALTLLAEADGAAASLGYGGDLLAVSKEEMRAFLQSVSTPYVTAQIRTYSNGAERFVLYRK